MARGRLSHAISSGELVLYYQPVAEARTGRVISLEALVRWEHPVAGLVLRPSSCPLAEDDEETIWELTLYTLRAGDRASAVGGSS